ncbi:hypothetical protein AAVH_04516 [Aphelenchoides avenae]|nr:hypothetical protein AAVH_04516 [Aphelenchus avenae]
MSINITSCHVAERKSPSPARDESLAGRNPFEELAMEVMQIIFSTFDLKERVKASMVCKKWCQMLTDGRWPLEDVVVMNIFERQVWLSTVSQNAGSKIKTIELLEEDNLQSVFTHCPKSSSVKIWYSSLEFVRVILRNLRDCGVRMRCVDIYPYSNEVGLELFHEYLPEVPGITMRPHGNDYFFSGLELNDFPKFQHVDTLHVDSFNLGPDAELPQSVTSLEWSNRNLAVFKEFIPKLQKLKLLEYLLIAHAEPNAEEFISFLDALFKFVKFDNAFRPEWPEQALKRLKFLKFDLCYGHLTTMVDRFLHVAGSNLRIISMNVISDECEVFPVLFEGVAKKLHERSISLGLGLLQRDTPTIGSVKRTSPTPRFVPATIEFARVLSKFEASFVTEPLVLKNVFSVQKYIYLTEIKMIQCSALTDDILGSISVTCLRLRKLSILSCHECSEIGILHFVQAFPLRLSLSLRVVWKRDRNQMRPLDLYRKLSNEYVDMLQGNRVKYFPKQFGEGHAGQAIVVWQSSKTLYIQDYDDFDRYRILGVVLPELSSA